MEPARMSSPPATTCQSHRSCRMRMPRKMVRATLNLSMGATLEAGPDWSALK